MQKKDDKPPVEIRTAGVIFLACIMALLVAITYRLFIWIAGF